MCIRDSTDHADYDADKIKEIAGIVEGSVSAESQLIMLAWWLKEQYLSLIHILQEES